MGGGLALRRHLPGVERRADGHVGAWTWTVGTTQLTSPTSVEPTSGLRLASERHEEVGQRPVGRIHADGAIDGGDVLVGQGRADLRGEVLVFVVEMRWPEILQIPVQRLLQRGVGQDIGDRADDLICIVVSVISAAPCAILWTRPTSSFMPGRSRARIE